MLNSICFVNEGTLPDKLSREETLKLMEEMNLGNKPAFDALVEHNIRLVILIVSKSYGDYEEKEDLVSVGIVGLIKSLMNFDPSKNVEFSTFASKCINNEILMYLRSENKRVNRSLVSLNEPIFTDENGKSISLLDTIESETEYFNSMEKEETYRIIHESLNILSERDRMIVMLYFGFIGDRRYTQREIAKICNLSQRGIFYIIDCSVRKLGVELEKRSIIDKKICPYKLTKTPNNQ